MRANGNDGMARRDFLRCMTWAGTGVIWAVGSGVLSSRALGSVRHAPPADFTFVQISDTHIGFNKDPNRDPAATMQEAIAQINALDPRPDLIVHTGDLTHLSKPAEFDTVTQLLRGVKIDQQVVLPGEHDFLDDGKQYLERFGRGTRGNGWYGFDHKGVHFVALVNVANLKPGGLGLLGAEQIEWLHDDLAARSASTPIVVLAHMPLWSVYPRWGWGTEDGETALALVKRFGSVTILNGHIHQVVQKVEGNLAFHTARSTAFPQPEAGAAESPGPMKDVRAERLRSMLGLTSVRYVENRGPLAIVDAPLG
jgi:3',5'-cyclic AMP phosphodiesterase CpdA